MTTTMATGIAYCVPRPRTQDHRLKTSAAGEVDSVTGKSKTNPYSFIANMYNHKSSRPAVKMGELEG